MNIQRAIDWNKAFGNNAGAENFDLQIAMLQEELDEYKEAVESRDRVERFDAILDLIFVAIGAAHADGLTAEQIKQWFDEVCDSNFSKLPMTKDENGKVQKWPNFVRPNLKQYL